MFGGSVAAQVGVPHAAVALSGSITTVAQAGVLGFVGCAWVIMIVALVAHRIRSARKMDEDPMA